MRVTLNELDVHIWRALALLLPDPTSFASCCKRGSQAVNDEGFRSEWFAVHHRSRAPDRPWQLLPSTVRRAQQMLAKDRALDALYGLCPASASLLFAYAAKSCNKDLMRQLLQRHATLREGFMFPQHWFKGAAGGIYLRTDLVCSLAALASGDLQMLRQLLPLSAGNYKEGWRSRLLLCYAARHRSAECLQEVLAARQAHAVCTQCTPLVAPQHLAMAAARTDPWAAGAR
ncbi:hypothetical protein OEZ86_000986 [Tetradesmus obliquus]|nr:hypothetical protein OEZ86_000986 [Tetradesmus obliquus]